MDQQDGRLSPAQDRRSVGARQGHPYPLDPVPGRRAVRGGLGAGQRRGAEAVPSYDPQELLTPDEVCALLKMKRTWFYAEVARGSFRPIKLGRRTRVRRRDLEAYLAGLEHSG